MDTQFFIYTAMLFLFGIFCGSLAAYLVFKYTLNKKLKDFNRFISTISDYHKAKTEYEKEKINSLIMLNEKFKELSPEPATKENPEFKKYLEDLNKLLNSRGIYDIGYGKKE